VTNRTSRYNWGPGFYIAPTEQRKTGEHYMVHPTLNLEPINFGGHGTFKVGIEVYSNAKPSNEWHAVEMSFYDSDRKPIGKPFTIKF